jgi:hypothetical protein
LQSVAPLPPLGSAAAAARDKVLLAEAVAAQRKLAATQAEDLQQLRSAYIRQFQAELTQLRHTVNADVGRLYANGRPTAQTISNTLNAKVRGAVDAMALQVVSQASLLPQSSNSLVPTLLNNLLGAVGSSLSNSLSSIALSPANNVSAIALQDALSNEISAASQKSLLQLENFFNTLPVTVASPSANGQQIPLEQVIAGEIVNQLGNNLGTLAQNFMPVATSVLFPNGVTATIPQSLVNALGTMTNNALATIASELGSDLSLLPGTSSLIAQLQPILFGNSSAAGGSTSLGSALQNLNFANSNAESQISNVFNTAFQGAANAINQAFDLTPQATVSLPTSGFTNAFGTQFGTSTFLNGFNNGFAVTPNISLVGFGVPVAGTFNANFANGFNNLNAFVNQNTGLGPATTGTNSNGTGTSVA